MSHRAKDGRKYDHKETPLEYQQRKFRNQRKGSERAFVKCVSKMTGRSKRKVRNDLATTKVAIALFTLGLFS